MSFFIARKGYLPVFALAVFALVFGRTLFSQRIEAQNKYGYDCAKEYQTTQLSCLDDMKRCSAECDEAYPHDPEGAAARCKSICDVDRNSCDALATDWYRECLGLVATDADVPTPVTAVPDKPPTPLQTTTPPPMTTPPSTVVTPSQPERPSAQTTPLPKSGVEVGDDSGNLELLPTPNLPEEIIVDGTFYTVALVDASTKNDFENMVSVAIDSGSSPEIWITLQSEPPTAFTTGRDGGFDSNALVPEPTYDLMLHTSNLAMVQPTIIFNDGTEDRFSLNIEELTRSSWLSDTNALGADADSLLQEKILEIMKKNPPAKTATFSLSKTLTKEPLVILSPADAPTDPPSPPTYSSSETISAGTSFVVLPGSLVVLDADTANMNAPVTTSGPTATSQAQDVDNQAMDGVDAVFEVKSGKMIVVAGSSAEDTLSSAPDFLSTLGDVGVRHHKTAYGMAIDPDSKKRIIEIYDGEIDVFDRKTGVMLATLSTEYGKGIQRVEIAADGTIKEQVAIPQSEWPAFVAKQQKTGFDMWVWVLIILFVAGSGYVVYRKGAFAFSRKNDNE